MLPAPLSGTLTVALAAVVAWCCYSLVRRPAAATAERVPTDVEAWHAVMGLTMLALLWRAPSPTWAWLGCGLFAWVVLWCAVRASNRAHRGHFWGIGLMSVVMVAMLLPAATASAATPASQQAPASDMSHMPGMTGMAVTDSSAGMLLSGPGAMAAALLMLVAVGLAVHLARRAPDVRTRLSATCEVVMASVMVVMALAMV